MSRPRVSVVIPTRNRPDRLARTIESVQRQTAVPIEILVVDNGSPSEMLDRTRDRLSRHTNLRLLSLTTGRGQALARNLGVEESAGEFVAFLDDDDLWLPRKLSAQLEALDSHGGGTRWAFSGCVWVNDELELLSAWPPPTSAECLANLPRRNVVYAGASNVLVARSLLAESGLFDAKFHHLCDWDLWLRLLAFGGAPAIVDAPHVAYVRHGQNLSDSPFAALSELEDLKVKTKDLFDVPLDEPAIYRWVAHHHLQVSQWGEAISLYLKAAKRGDLRSLLRLIAACLRIRARPRPLPQAGSWAKEATEWLREFASECGPLGPRGQSPETLSSQLFGG